MAGLVGMRCPLSRAPSMIFAAMSDEILGGGRPITWELGRLIGVRLSGSSLDQ